MEHKDSGFHLPFQFLPSVVLVFRCSFVQRGCQGVNDNARALVVNDELKEPPGMHRHPFGL